VAAHEHGVGEQHTDAGEVPGVDQLRELIDGAVGMNENNTSMPTGNAAWWAEYREHLEGVARKASGQE
jgi:hypothetical protein